MKKLHKQIISMLLCAVMALSLVACGNNSTPSDTTPVADDGTVSGTLEISTLSAVMAVHGGNGWSMHSRTNTLTWKSS